MDKQRKPLKISSRLFLATGAIFIIAGIIIVALVNYMERQQALVEAETKACIILNRNLAIHTYFTRQLKPKLFGSTDPVRSKDYFEPTWMSSTYAIREIDKYYRLLESGDYYYKESAINARSPENEADAYEKSFIEEMNADSGLVTRSVVRVIDGKPYFVVLRRNEVMEETCLRCHSTPDKAPADLVRYYGPERSFNRKVGEVVSAISIRVPLAFAYENADRFSWQLSILLLTVLGGLFGLLWFINKRMLLKPLLAIQNKALMISSSDEHLGEQIPLPAGRELRELTAAFNDMSTGLRHHLDHLEERVKERTAEIFKINEQLKQKVEEYKQAADALRESESRLNTAQQIAHLGSWERNLETNKLYWSDEQYRIWGYEPGEVIPDFELVKSHIHPDDIKRFEEANDKAFYKDEPINQEYRIIRKDGVIRTVHSIAKVERGERGQPKRLFGSLQDITERRRLEAQLQQAQKLEAIGVLAGGIAHDFNNLLSIIMGNISMTKHGVKPEYGVTDFLNEAEEASLKAKELVNQLITFSRGGAPVKKTGSVGYLVKETTDLILAESNVKSEFFIPSNLYTVEFDQDQMKLAIKNIIVNAVKSMPESGSIMVKADNFNLSTGRDLPLPEGKYVKISIRDQGVGIPEEHLSMIFDPYFSTKEMGSQKGMGLGLATTYSIINRHDGHITVESEVGVGTTFTIYLPAHEKEVIALEPIEIPKPETLEIHTGKILLMDDENSIGKIAKQMLSRLGYDSDFAKDGTEAIEHYQEAIESGKPFEAVILDLTIKKGMGGVDTVKKLMAIDPRVRAIVSSGYSNDPVMTDFRKYGFMGALAKPYTMKDLSDTLNSVLGKS